MSYIEDQRWNGHYNISTSKLVIDTSIQPHTQTWTMELWLNLKPFPLKSESRSRSGSNRLTMKPLEIKYTDKYLIINGTQIKYQQQEWFQLVLVSGSEGSLVRDSIRAYINGRLVNHSISGLSSINRLVFKNYSIRKNPLESGSMLGLVRIYNVSLGKHYIQNNYSGNSSQFGLELVIGGPITKHGLIKTLPKPKKDVKKNAITSYSKMDSSELHQLSKLFASMQSPSARPKPKQSKRSCRGSRSRSRHSMVKKQIPPNVFKLMSLLNSNPEVFMRRLQQGALIDRSEPAPESSISMEETDSLFSDQVKVDLLVSYFKRSPKSLIAVLKNNLLNSEQLTKLMFSFNKSDSDGFHDYNPDLEQALALLDATQQQLHLQRQPRSLPQVATPDTRIADSLGQIADMMNHDRQKQRIIRDVKAKNNVLSSIKRLNDSSLTNEAKLNQLEKVLAKQNEILGLVVSQRSGKCVGTIKGNGKIKKAPTIAGACKCKSKSKGRCNCANNSSPYNIILNTKKYQVNMKNILNQHQLQGQTIKKLVKIAQKPDSEITIVGQCINRDHLTIAAIVVYKKENHYLPTITSKPYPGLPILAMIDANPKEKAESEAVAEAEAGPKETVAKCLSGSCGPGFKQVEPEIAQKGWLSHLSESESENANDIDQQSSLFAYTSLFK